MVNGMAGHLTRVSPDFDADVFLDHALNGLGALEMMARAEQISQALDAAFPNDIALKTHAMVAALHPRDDMALKEMKIDAQGIAGWAVVAMARVIARGGLQHPESSLAALSEMTKRFSAEFAVRPFFRDHPEVTLQTAMRWSGDANVHVRRLATEGSRPLLPWGIKLKDFVENPSPLLPLLTRLRDDEAEYVRRSVANSLNDIAKSQPDLVADLAKEWLRGAARDRKRLVKHACRTLIKQGHHGALRAFGYTEPDLKEARLEFPERVSLGQSPALEFCFTAGRDQRLLIDYALHFMRANGTLSPKVFKWTEVDTRKGQRTRIAKVHAYKPVTTRKDYAGTQVLSVQVNGREVARKAFEFAI